MSTMQRSALSAFVVVLLLLAAGVAPAAAQTSQVTYVFSGQITYVSGTPFGISTAVGQPVSGTIAYDTSLPAAFDTGSVAGYIDWPAVFSGMTVTIAGVTVQSHNCSFQVLNDAYGVDNFNGYFPLDAGGAISFSLGDPTQTALSSTALPPSLSVASFSQRIGTAWDSTNGGYLTYSIDTLEPLALPVTIDVKPGSSQNSINPASAGQIPVAVLTTGTFDATTVDPSSVRFGRTGHEAAAVQSALEDVNGDGRVDMILHFDTQASGIKCGDTSAALTGKLWSGQAIKGTDTIVTVSCTP